MSQTETKKKQKQYISSQNKKSKNKAKNKFGSLVYNYDEEADVLYAYLGEPKPAESIDYENGIVVRKDPKSKKYIGFTIINYRDRKRQGKLKKIPHFKYVELPNY